MSLDTTQGLEYSRMKNHFVGCKKQLDLLWCATYKFRSVLAKAIENTFALSKLESHFCQSEVCTMQTIHSMFCKRGLLYDLKKKTSQSCSCAPGLARVDM